ncbi:MAG TPA: type VI secretion system tip protein TssI/VgrG [Reyranella sp.]|nr:type VI secretion system tip protein TssI/VgrG [Reyranella sp.]
MAVRNPVARRALLSLQSPAGDDLIPVRLLAHEKISEMFRFEIEAMSTETIKPLSMLNMEACLMINYREQPVRYFHGIISEFEAAGRTALEQRYVMVLRPHLVQTDLHSDCRMYFDKTAEDIITVVLNDGGVTPFQFNVSSPGKVRKQTAQYNETGLHFITRLMEEEGWFYYFKHAAGSHTLIITDKNPGFTTTDVTLRPGTGIDNEVLSDLRKPDEITHGKMGLRDYDHEAPSKDLKVDQNTVLKHAGTGKRDVFHWPALTYDVGNAKQRARWRMEAAEAAVSLVGVSGTNTALYPGAKFKLKSEEGTQAGPQGGALPGEDEEYVVREMNHVATDQSRLADSGTVHYTNTMTAFPNKVPWRQPMLTARPRMEGLHTAIVLAPSGEEIHTDKYGRIKVRFFWDHRQEATADNAEWVRVVQPWAGKGWGALFIPRVDTEVAVAFMDGDVDRPVVVGGLYNGQDSPIYSLPGDKTKLGFKSRSSLKGGSADFNEFTFEDKKGSEEIVLHAQKDWNSVVENDQTLKVDHDRTVTVKNNETVTIKEGNQSNTVEMGNQSNRVKMGNISEKVDLGSITVEAMQSITLKVGSNSVTIDQTGVTVKGIMVTVEGQAMADVKSPMTTVKGDGMLTLKGGITMIN